MSEKVCFSNEHSEVGKPNFTFNLQQLKAVHHIYKGKDVSGKSQIWNVSTIQRPREHDPAILAFNHLHFAKQERQVCEGKPSPLEQTREVYTNQEDQSCGSLT